MNTATGFANALTQAMTSDEQLLLVVFEGGHKSDTNFLEDAMLRVHEGEEEGLIEASVHCTMHHAFLFHQVHL